MMRRTPLRRTPLRPKPRDERSAYANRERDGERMVWVKSLGCAAHALGGCAGPIEADHAGRRGLGRKADDDTCIPLCQLHHHDRHAFAGVFRTWNQPMMRAFLERAIEMTRAAWNARN